jgi:hypothetical protein
MLANDIGNAPVRLLLLSLLYQIQETHIRYEPRKNDFINIRKNDFRNTYMYLRFLRWPREGGISPLKKLLERSSV